MTCKKAGTGCLVCVWRIASLQSGRGLWTIVWHEPAQLIDFTRRLKLILMEPFSKIVMKAVIGIVSRNFEGKCVSWRTNRSPGSFTPEYIETLIAIEAGEFAIWRGWMNVPFEGDCKNLIQKLHDQDPDASDLGNLVVLYSFSFIRLGRMF